MGLWPIILGPESGPRVYWPLANTHAWVGPLGPTAQQVMGLRPITTHTCWGLWPQHHKLTSQRWGQRPQPTAQIPQGPEGPEESGPR